MFHQCNTKYLTNAGILIHKTSTQELYTGTCSDLKWMIFENKLKNGKWSSL